MRTIHGFAKEENHDNIKETTKNSIKETISKLEQTAINSQEEYDRFHKKACERLIESFKPQDFTYGQAQKWINMTFKYLFLLDYEGTENVYKYLHIPIDKYILKSATPPKKIFKEAWSKLNDYNKYLEYQIWFRENFPKDIPLDREFVLWIEAAKKEKTKKRKTK